MKRTLALILAVVMVFALCACGSGSSAPAQTTTKTEPSASETASAPAASGEKVTIKLCAIDPAEQNTNDVLRECIAEISERTNGMVDIQLYTDGQMLVYAEGVEAVMSNANVIVVSQSSYLSDYLPFMSVFGSPYVFPSREVALEFFHSDFFAGLAQEAEEAGVHIICADALTGFRRDLRIPSS